MPRLTPTPTFTQPLSSARILKVKDTNKQLLLSFQAVNWVIGGAQRNTKLTTSQCQSASTYYTFKPTKTDSKSNNNNNRMR